MRSALAFALLALLGAAPAKPTWVVPDFRDLTIKTRQTRGLTHPTVTTRYFKGARQRVEGIVEGSRMAAPFAANIIQCDQGRMVRLLEFSKTYTSFRIHERDGQERRRPRLRNEPTGPGVTVTFDSVDTGERRQFGSYEGRRVKTTITVKPSKGAVTKPGKSEIDAWYIDLQGLNCHDEAPSESYPPTDWVTMIAIGAHDHVVVQHLGTTPRGLAVEETAQQRQAGNRVVNKTELLEISERPLDESLFEIPPDYRPHVQPKPHGLRPIPKPSTP